MWTKTRLPLALGWLLAVAPAHAAGYPPLGEYAGSDRCAACHPEHYAGWQESPHATVTQNPRENPETLLGDFGQEVGFTPGDIQFTIGGHWYQRYATEIDGSIYVLPKVWSVANHRWETQDEWSWKRKPYRQFCFGCHATRYDPDDNSRVEHRVGCEACHGPGGDHAESQGKQAILNPAHWTDEDQDLLCASCHVRGMDRSGRYYYSVGYVPGRNLTDHYTPNRVRDDESPRQSMLRQVRDWIGRLGNGPPAACDTCGIDRSGSATAEQTMSEQCSACHQYGDRYEEHTRHPGSLQLQCLDCHRGTAAREEPGSRRPDVHVPEHFAVHSRAYKAQSMDRACADCHQDRSPKELRRTLRLWDHSNHGDVTGTESRG